MAHHTARSRIGQFLMDAALGLALFAALVSFGTDGGNARAEVRPAPDAAVYAAAPSVDASSVVMGLVSQASPQALTLSLPRPQAFYKNEQVVLSMLALVFATLFALNLGFWRHLRRTYAPTA